MVALAGRWEVVGRWELEEGRLELEVGRWELEEGRWELEVVVLIGGLVAGAAGRFMEEVKVGLIRLEEVDR